MKIRDAAESYIDKGWYPVPLKSKSKECRDKDWMDRVYSAGDFQAEDNLGIRLVNSQDELREVKLVGLDLDCPEAVASAWAFLPISHAAWGRDSKPISQILYICPFEKAVVFRDYVTENKATLLEIRVNHQSMAPPSIHPDGEQLRWLSEKIEAPEVTQDELLRGAKLLATSSMVARYYAVSGSRHEWTLALSGTLRRLGLGEEEVALVFKEAGGIAGDSKIQDRVSEVHSTFSKAEDDPVTGANILAQQMPETGKKFVETLRRIWGSGSDFTVSEKSGRAVQGNPDNIRSAILKLGIDLGEDIFAQRFVYKNGNGWQRFSDAEADRLWLEVHAKFNFLPSRDVFDTVIRDQARKHKMHPIREYLDGLQWDGVERVRGWLSRYAGAASNAYTDTVGTLTLVAAVRRVRQPGCKFDEILVLESPQGQNKSTALKILAITEEWFGDDLPLGVDSKQVIERTSGKWIIEAAELMNMRRAHIEQLKASMSRQVDGPVRLAYGRFSVEVPRQFICIGTTNSTSYLKDETGNRRFWPVAVKRFDLDSLAEDRDQVWAEAASIEKSNSSIRLPEALWDLAGMQQERRRKEDAWEEVLRNHIDKIKDPKQRVLPTEIWKLLGFNIKDVDENVSERVHRIMNQLGFKKVAIRRGNIVAKGWGRDIVRGQIRDPNFIKNLTDEQLKIQAESNSQRDAGSDPEGSGEL